ncbi:MAG: hypothetical protein ABR985_22120 [Methanotrichaceae archaeon]|jgi:hypothetical protein
MRSDIPSIDKAKLCFSNEVDLSKEHFIELIEERVQDCEAWERKLRSQGEFKDAERMRKAGCRCLKASRG